MATVYQTPIHRAIVQGQLMSRPTSKSWGVNGHATRGTSPVCLVLQLWLVSARGLMKWTSAPLYWLMMSGKDFTIIRKSECPEKYQWWWYMLSKWKWNSVLFYSRFTSLELSYYGIQQTSGKAKFKTFSWTTHWPRVAQSASEHNVN